MITNLTSSEKHYIPIAAQHATVSKNYIFISEVKRPGTKSTGFYVIRLIDLYHLGFKSPIPLYQIPTNHTLGHVTQVSVEHNSLLEESILYFKTDLPSHPIHEILFKDVEDLIKAQIFSYALYQAMNDPRLKPVNDLIAKFKKRLEVIFSDLHKDLNRIGGKNWKNITSPKLKKLNWKKATAQEVATALKSTHKNPKIKKLAHTYVLRLSKLLTAFHNEHDALMAKVSLSYELPKSKNLTQTTPLPKKERKTYLGDWWDGLNGDEKTASKVFLGIGISVVFVTLVLPKIVKKPFSKMAADYGLWHYNLLTKSRIRQLAYRIAPKYFETSQSGFAKFINSLGQIERDHRGLMTTARQFKRSFWQVSGDTATVVISELITRPFLRNPGGKDAKSAIMLTEPFSKTHSLWMQKNFLYRVIGTQVLGSIMTTVSISILEKEFDELLRKFIFDNGVERKITDDIRRRAADKAFRFSETQQRHLAETMNNDIRALRDKIEKKASALIREGHKAPTLNQMDLQTKMKSMRTQWISEIEKIVQKESSNFRFRRPFREQLMIAMDAKMAATSNAVLKDYLEKRANPGFMKKLGNAFALVFEFTLGRFVSKEKHHMLRFWSNKTWELWTSINKSYFYNSMMMQQLTRGTANPTLFGFTRIISLLITTPIYVTTYTWAKGRFGLRSAKAEFLYGFLYGIVTNTISNALFVNIYEKRIMGSWVDVEIDGFAPFK